jgi:hypothetical protein
LKLDLASTEDRDHRGDRGQDQGLGALEPGHADHAAEDHVGQESDRRHDHGDLVVDADGEAAVDPLAEQAGRRRGEGSGPEVGDEVRDRGRHDEPPLHAPKLTVFRGLLDRPPVETSAGSLS